MRIGVVADIHGSLQALEAVLKDVKVFTPDIVIVAGDMIGGGPQPKEVLELLSTVDHMAVRGTHEDLLLIVSRGEEGDTNMFVEAARYDIDVLGQEWIDYLAALPDHRYLDICSTRDVCVAHGILATQAEP